jgi:hypothetical protein
MMNILAMQNNDTYFFFGWWLIGYLLLKNILNKTVSEEIED